MKIVLKNSFKKLFSQNYSLSNLNVVLKKIDIKVNHILRSLKSASIYVINELVIFEAILPLKSEIP